jgi:hypothetical protein
MSVLREMTYGGMQWGLYTPFKTMYASHSEGSGALVMLAVSALMHHIQHLPKFSISISHVTFHESNFAFSPVTSQSLDSDSSLAPSPVACCDS